MLQEYVGAFLDCLAPGEQLHTFQTFHDREKGHAGHLLHGSFAQHEQTLHAWQTQTHGVFWTINATNLAGRELQDITRIRCVWLDIDTPGADIAPICAALQPHAVVESSPGKHHLYWRVADCPVELAQPLLVALRTRWGGDKGATGINRVLRLPGFWHLKGEPFQTRIVSTTPGAAPYTVEQIRHHLIGPEFTEVVNRAAAPTEELIEGPVDGWRNTLSDERLSNKLNGLEQSPPTAAEAFAGGNRWSLHELWCPDMAALEAAEVRSEARMSLLTRLMFLTGGDTARIHKLVQGHALAVKNDREGLLVKELARARDVFMQWWEPEHARRQAQEQETRQLAAGLVDAPGDTPPPLAVPNMTTDEMVNGLVHIAKGSYVVVRGSKQSFRREDASTYFAASKEEMIDAATGKPKKVKCLEIWGASAARLTAGLMTWQPDEPEFCRPLDEVDGHETAYNVWKGLPRYTAPDNWREWAAWFEHHVAYLVPVEAERRRFMQWLAHMVQKPGELPHTGYLMITRQTGTGRNWLASILARVMRGYCAMGVPLVPILDGKFNGILSRKLLATVDEIREGNGEGRYSRSESLKKLLNEERRQIDVKYGLQTVEKNCTRWLAFSNHDDGLPLDETDRRWILIDNPTHLQSDEYYATLYSMLAYPQFVASVRHLLQTLDLTGFNPGERAPMNATKVRAVESMKPGIDQAVIDFAKTWPGTFATASDLAAHVHSFTGEAPRFNSLKHVKARCGIETVMIPRLLIDGRRETVLRMQAGAQGDPDQIIDVIKRARKMHAG